MPPKQGLRRSHTKSRRGCLQCKARHTKCSEERPRCQNCLRLQLDCSYASPAATTASPGTVLDQAISDSASAVPGADARTIDGPLHMLDLELLHNYMYGPAIHLFSGNNVHIFRNHYVRAGLQHPFVMHIILATSGFEMALRCAPRPELGLRATHHQTTALKLARPHLADLTDDSAIAMFIFSGFVTVCAQSAVFVHARPGPWDPLHELLGCMALSRGIQTVIEQHFDAIQRSWLHPLLQMHLESADYAPGWESTYPALGRVLALIDADAPPANRAILRPAMEALVKFACVLFDEESPEESVRLTTTWQVHISQEFVDLVQVRCPLGLVVMAYYAMLMSLRPDVWWLRRWPRPLLEQIEALLGDRYAEHLVWPREVIESRLLRPVADEPGEPGKHGENGSYDVQPMEL